MNSHLMASCVRNIRTKNYQNLMIGFQVTVENVWDGFFETQCCSRQIHRVLQYCHATWGILSITHQYSPMNQRVGHTTDRQPECNKHLRFISLLFDFRHCCLTYLCCASQEGRSSNFSQLFWSTLPGKFYSICYCITLCKFNIYFFGSLLVFVF